MSLTQLSCCLALLMGLPLPHVHAQRLALYKSYDGHLYSRQQLDSTVAQLNRRLQGQGMGAYVEEKTKVQHQDTLLYTYTITRAPQATVAAHAQLMQWIGKPLPAFSLRDLAGQVVTSTTLRGQPVVINMWFTTCKGCIAEMPALNAVMAAPANKGIHFIALTYEKPTAVRAFLQKRAFTFRHLPDAQAYCNQFTQAYPITLFVDRLGFIRAIQGPLPFMGAGAVSAKPVPTADGEGYLDATALYSALDEIRLK